MDVEIRIASPTDAQAIYEITKQAFAKYERDLGMTGHVTAMKETVEDILQDIEQKIVLIGCVDEKPVGSVRFEILGDLAYLSRFGVVPSVQKSGIGGMLVDKVEEICREQSVRAIALHTSSRMFGLIRFYYGHGYFIHSTSTDRGYIRALLVHELELPGSYDLEPVMGK